MEMDVDEAMKSGCYPDLGLLVGADATEGNCNWHGKWESRYHLWKAWL